MLLSGIESGIAGIAQQSPHRLALRPSKKRSSQHGRTGRIALGHVVALREPHPFGSELVQIWRIDFRAETPNISEANVVPYDEYDIWTVIS